MRLTAMRVLIVFVLVLVSSARVFAYETRFGVDPVWDLAELRRSGKIMVRAGKSGGVYRSDASAVLRVDPERIFSLSMDYGRFVEMGMPHLRASRVVERSNEFLYVWSWMSMAGQSSRHYLEVRERRDIGPIGAAGVEWQLAHRRPWWPHEEESSFSRLDGSWYVEPLPGGAVYVRYFLAAVIDTPVPDFLVQLVAKRAFRDGVKGVIQALGREAAK